MAINKGRMESDSMSDYRDKYVKCPFYVSQDARKVHCNGFSDDCYIHVAFSSAENKEAFVERRCNSLFGYLKCPLYPMLAKRFEEEGK